MLNANNSYMHKHYIRFETDAALSCIQHYYEHLNVNQETLEHLIMQFVGMPLAIIRSRATTRNLLNIPWIFKSWDDAFAYYRSRHFQEVNERHAVTPFLTGAIEAYIVNKFEVKERIYARTKEFNLVSIEELIMTNKIQLPDVKHFQKHVTAVINDLQVKQTKEEIHDVINTVIENPKFTAELPEYLKAVLYKHLDTLSAANQQMFIDILMRISKMAVGEVKRLYKVRGLIDVCSRNVTAENVPVVLSTIAQNISTLFPVKEENALPTDNDGKVVDVVLDPSTVPNQPVLRGKEAMSRIRELLHPIADLREFVNANYDVEVLNNAFKTVLLNATWNSTLTDFLKTIRDNALVKMTDPNKKLFCNIILEIADMTDEEVRQLHADKEIIAVYTSIGMNDVELSLTLIAHRIGRLFFRDCIKCSVVIDTEPKIKEAYQVVDGVKTDIRDVDPIAEMNEAAVQQNILDVLKGDTILTIDILSEWVVNVLGLSTIKSTLVQRIVDHAKERELIGKPAYSFMVELANGFFTYSFKNLRHAEDNFKKLKRFAQKFVKANGPSLDPQKPKTPVTQTDSKEETIMSAKPTQTELYQTITKDPIDVKAVRALVRQLFIDSQNREPREAIIDRFMESIDVSAHEHWSFLINFMLSDNYKPNLIRLPFGEMIFAKLKVYLGKLEKSGTFDFSGIPATNDYAGIDTQRNPSLDTAKKEDVSVTKVEDPDVTKETTDTETVGLGSVSGEPAVNPDPAVNETTNKPYEAKMAGGLVEGQQPVTAENNFGRGRETALGFEGDGHWKLGLRPMMPGMLPPKSQEEDEQDKAALKEKAIRFNIMRKAFQNIFHRDNFSTAFTMCLADEVAEFAIDVKVGVEPLYPIINGQPATFVPTAHHEIFNDVMALQLIAFYLLHEKDAQLLENPDFLYSILQYESNVISELKVRSNNGKWFSNNHYTAHLNVLPTFSNIEGDVARASYMIASTLVSPDRANEILMMVPAPILTDLSLVPAEYLPGQGDTIQTDLIAIGILQTLITLFTAEEIDVKQDKPKAIDNSKTKKSEKEAAKTDNTEQKIPQRFRDAVVKMFGATITPEKYLEVFDNFEGDFINEMAKELKRQQFNTDLLKRELTVQQLAFMAVETFLGYVIHNQHQPKVWVLGGFLYSYTQFQSAKVFDEQVKSQLLTVLRIDYAKDYPNVSGPNALNLVTRITAGDDKEEFNQWYMNSPLVVLPTSELEFTNQLSMNYFSNTKYSAFLIAYALLSIASKLNFKEKPLPPVIDREHIANTVVALTNNNLNAFLTTTIVNKVIVISKELELSNESVNQNIELLIKTALTVCLLEGTIEHSLNTAIELSKVYKLTAPRPTADYISDEHRILRMVATVTNHPVNDVAALHYAKGDAYNRPYVTSLDLLSVETVSINTLTILTVRDSTPESKLFTQQQHSQRSAQPQMQPGMPYIGQPQPGMGYYPTGHAVTPNQQHQQMYGYQPQPAMYPQQHYGSQYDGPRSQPFQYPTAPMAQPNPNYRHPQPANMPQMQHSACLGGSQPHVGPEMSRAQMVQMIQTPQMQAYDTQRGFFNPMAQAQPQMPRMQRGSMMDYMMGESDEVDNSAILAEIQYNLDCLERNLQQGQMFWNIISSALRKIKD